MAERKSTAVLIKLSPTEKRALDAAARRENLPMATWMRALCLHAARAANEKGHTMKTILAIAILGLAACGGSSDVTGEPAATARNLSGTYTFNQFLYSPFDATQVGQTGQMTITQTGNTVTASATTRYPAPFPSSLEGIRHYTQCLQLSCTQTAPITCECVGHDIATDTLTRQWTGTVADGPNGTTIVKLAETSSALPDGRSTVGTFTATVDAAGNLHGDCATGIEQMTLQMRCDATR